MTAQIATVLCGSAFPKWPPLSEGDASFTWLDNSNNQKTPCECYQEILNTCTADILIYLHADVTIHDPEWLTRIMRLFENPDCVVAGLGGATSLGRPALYKKPWNIWNLARGGYASNQTDWQVHGSHEAGDRQVAVLDAFCMAVRTEWLRNRGGWPVKHLTFHCLDLWLACEAMRDDKSTFITGASVTHHGGGTSVTDKYAQASWLQGDSLQSDHQTPHRWLFENYRDCLPIVVSQ